MDVTHHTSRITRHVSHVTRHTSHITFLTSHITRGPKTALNLILIPGTLNPQPETQNSKPAYHVTRHTSTSHVTRHTSYVTFVTSHITRGPETALNLILIPGTLNPQPETQNSKPAYHVTLHTSHFTRHTSHVTSHTSHVTHHTSHFTPVPSNPKP